MRAGEIEETQIPRNPLDVLAQQIVAISVDEEISVADLHDLVRRAYPFADLSRVQLENVLDMLCPAATPRTSSPKLRPADRLGPHRRRDPRPRRRAAARGHERWARSPTAASSWRTSWWKAAVSGSASSTRRWSTRRGSATRSCSARRPGGSRRSPATACSSRRPRGCRAPSRSGRAREWGGRTSSRQKIGAASRELGALGDERRARAVC